MPATVATLPAERASSSAATPSVVRQAPPSQESEASDFFDSAMVVNTPATTSPATPTPPTTSPTGFCHGLSDVSSWGAASEAAVGTAAGGGGGAAGRPSTR